VIIKTRHWEKCPPSSRTQAAKRSLHWSTALVSRSTRPTNNNILLQPALKPHSWAHCASPSSWKSKRISQKLRSLRSKDQQCQKIISPNNSKHLGTLFNLCLLPPLLVISQSDLQVDHISSASCCSKWLRHKLSEEKLHYQPIFTHK